MCPLDKSYFDVLQMTSNIMIFGCLIRGLRHGQKLQRASKGRCPLKGTDSGSVL